MDVVEETKEKARDVVSGGREKTSMTKRVLVSLAASAASGATAYAARKVPGFVQGTVLPKLRELTANGGVLDKAKQAVENAVPAVGGDGQEAPRRSSRPRVTPAQAQKRARERAERRSERKAALSK